MDRSTWLPSWAVRRVASWFAPNSKTKKAFLLKTFKVIWIKKGSNARWTFKLKTWTTTEDERVNEWMPHCRFHLQCPPWRCKADGCSVGELHHRLSLAPHLFDRPVPRSALVCTQWKLQTKSNTVHGPVRLWTHLRCVALFLPKCGQQQKNTDLKRTSSTWSQHCHESSFGQFVISPFVFAQFKKIYKETERKIH